MPTVDLLIAAHDQGAKISEHSWSPNDQPTLHIDPVDIVSFSKLLKLITGDDFGTILQSYVKLTPEQPGVELWEVDKLLAQVNGIPEKYVSALANIDDDQISAFAEEWSAIEEFKWYNFAAADLAEQISSFREFARQSIESQQALLMRMAT